MHIQVRHGEGFFLITSIYLLFFALPAVYPSQPNFDCAGFATQNGGIKGGQGGQTFSAASYSQLKSYAENTASYIIMVQGTISNGSGGGQIRVKSNKSIIGVGSSAFLSGVGIDISSQNNVIIRNLRISLVGTSNPGSVNGGDCISISGTSKNIWIDHCEIFSEDPEKQTDKDKYDGLIDIKQQTGFITLSWNYLHDHHKGGLVGAADDDLYADRKITLHHNYYNKVLLRIPMYRGATGHFFNNYIVGATDATEIRAGTCVRVEKNYYDSLHYSIYTPTDAPGSTERIDNIEISRASRAYPTDCKAAIPYDYANVLTNTTEDIRIIVPLYAGVEKDPSSIAPEFAVTSGPEYVLASGIVTEGKAGENRFFDLRGRLVFKGSQLWAGLYNGILIENVRGVNRVIFRSAYQER
jgi:pectate lyase